jgi:hypothetical protein
VLSVILMPPTLIASIYGMTHARARLVLRLSARTADDGIGCGRTYSLSET